MPLSFAGFGPVAILIMVLNLMVVELYRYIKRRQQQH